MADYVTLTHRAILRTGTWNASTGTEPITDDDLKAIVAAAESGVLDNPVIKLGHVDPRFKTYLEDGSPAYGQMTNPVIEGDTLYVDYINVPIDLAEGIDSAYPHSSVELARNVVLRDQDGNVVHEFSCVLTANALLGETAPAVKGLSTRMSDISAKASGTPTYIEIRGIQFSLPGGTTAMDLADRLAAAVDASHSGDTSWAYLQDFTDEEVIFTVEGYGDAAHYRQSYTVPEGSKIPELTGDPVQVIKETKWVAEGEKVAAAAKKGGDTASVHPPASETAQAMSEEPTPTSSKTQGETTMAVDKQKAAGLRKDYGLAANASTDELLAAIIAEKDKKNVPPGSDETPNDKVAKQQIEEATNIPNFAEGDEDEDAEEETPDAEETEGEEDEEEGDEEAEQQPAPVRRDLKTRRPAAKGKVGLKSAQVSPSLLSEVTTRLSAAEARLAAREKAETDSRRDAYVRQWYREGLIHDDEAEKVRANLERNEELTVELITDRVPMFATSEIGHAEPTIYASAQNTSTIDAEYAADDAAFGITKK